MTTYICDSVHGNVKIEPYARLIIETPYFARLRHLKQLGGACYTFPTATHSRYEHSIGVYHLTNLFATQLLQKETPTHQRLKTLVCIAALCHDLGHGPFSHSFDTFLQNLMKEETQSKDFKRLCLSHEERSCQQFKRLIEYVMERNPKEYELHLNLNEEEIESICAMILGKKPPLHDLQRREYLCHLVSDSVSGVDTDRLDYLLRDSRAIGRGLLFDPGSLLKSAQVYRIQARDMKKDARCIVCYSRRDEYELSQLFHTRYSLFKVLYCRPDVCAFDAFLEDLFREAIAAGVLDLERALSNPDDFLELDDRILYMIEKQARESQAPSIKGLKDMCKRLETDDTYTIIYNYSFPNRTRLTHPLADSDKGSSEKEKLLWELLEGDPLCTPQNVRVVVYDINYGHNHNNPRAYLATYLDTDIPDVIIPDALLKRLFKDSSDPFDENDEERAQDHPFNDSYHSPEKPMQLDAVVASQDLIENMVSLDSQPTSDRFGPSPFMQHTISPEHFQETVVMVLLRCSRYDPGYQRLKMECTLRISQVMDSYLAGYNVYMDHSRVNINDTSSVLVHRISPRTSNGIASAIPLDHSDEEEDTGIHEPFLKC
ncbi:DGTP triphosphohydrolase [Giardia muris]|uniref:dGTP triphosphohydrolase n=1 Tax=Giardia muris TaxID=5742 RepID=A0A4Z1SXA5_GIAMU|nr:DGTP triphosphohydrolase [Giardia muris]|eukprot:TNJ30336.1 DGTP triphosphohydrolase [Giardia muris]